MKILKKAIGKKYEIKCYGCLSKLEATEEDILYEGSHSMEIKCPVCNMNRTINRLNIRVIPIYEDEEA